ncbi:hypothetical protein L4D02_23580, partial [Vibrio splendidus]
PLLTMAARTSVNNPYQPRPLNFLLEYNKAWESMVATDLTLRDIEIIEVTKMLACSKPALGGIERHCESKECPHGLLALVELVLVMVKSH